MEKNAKDAVGALTDLYRDHFSGDQEQAQEAVDKIVGNRVTQLMELESMTDEQREIHTLKEEKHRLQEERDTESSQRRYEEEAQRVHAGNQTAVPLLDNSIKKFDLEMGSPEDEEASETLAGYVRQGQAVTQELADQVVKDVITRKRQLLQDSVSGMSAEDLMTTNPELAEALRDKSIEQIKESRATKAAKPQRAPTKKRRKRDEKTLDTVSSNDFFNETDW